jgi:hypothetical protein
MALSEPVDDDPPIGTADMTLQYLFDGSCEAMIVRNAPSKLRALTNQPEGDHDEVAIGSRAMRGTVHFRLPR